MTVVLFLRAGTVTYASLMNEKIFFVEPTYYRTVPYHHKLAIK